MATQCLVQKKSKSMLIASTARSAWRDRQGCGAAIIGRIGTAGGTGYAIEFRWQQRHPRSVDGGSNDPLQHGHRKAARMGFRRGRRYDHRPPAGCSFSPKGDAWEKAAACWRIAS